MWNRPDYCLTEGIKAIQRQMSTPAFMTWHNHLEGIFLFILCLVNRNLEKTNNKLDFGALSYWFDFF